MNLFGEGNFALTAAKEIDATQDYLDMSKDVTNCQNEVSLEVCETKKYYEKVMEKCNCLPVNIGSSYKVQVRAPPTSPFTPPTSYLTRGGSVWPAEDRGAQVE